MVQSNPFRGQVSLIACLFTCQLSAKSQNVSLSAKSALKKCEKI